MVKKVILGVMVFYCIAFGSVSAHPTEEVKLSVDSERLFFEAGNLYLATEHGEFILLKSLFYEGGRCYTVFPPEIIQNFYYTQGYRCNGCGYTFIKTTPGAPGICPVCKKYDWTLF